MPDHVEFDDWFDILKKVAVSDFGYDITAGYFLDENSSIWLEYYDRGLTCSEAIIEELGE